MKSFLSMFLFFTCLCLPSYAVMGSTGDHKANLSKSKVKIISVKRVKIPTQTHSSSQPSVEQSIADEFQSIVEDIKKEMGGKIERIPYVDCILGLSKASNK